MQDTCKAKFLCVCIYVAGFILLSFVLGVFISQPQMPLSMTGMLTKLSGESAFSLMSLLGASIMPHSFYLHSSIVQVFVLLMLLLFLDIFLNVSLCMCTLVLSSDIYIYIYKCTMFTSSLILLVSFLLLHTVSLRLLVHTIFHCKMSSFREVCLINFRKMTSICWKPHKFYQLTYSVHFIKKGRCFHFQ